MHHTLAGSIHKLLPPPHVPGTLLHTVRKGATHHSQPAPPVCLPLRPRCWHPQQLLLPRPSGLSFLLCRPGYSWSVAHGGPWSWKRPPMKGWLSQQYPAPAHCPPEQGPPLLTHPPRLLILQQIHTAGLIPFLELGS